MLKTLFLLFFLIALCALCALAVLFWPRRSHPVREKQTPWWFDREPY